MHGRRPLRRERASAYTPREDRHVRLPLLAEGRKDFPVDSYDGPEGQPSPTVG